MMGGTCRGYGNITLTGEYNLWADPEAAKIVRNEIPFIHVVPWEIADNFKLKFEEGVEKLMDGHEEVTKDDRLNPTHLFYTINKINTEIDNIIYCADGLAMAAAVCDKCYPQSDKYRVKCYTDILLEGIVTRGSLFLKMCDFVDVFDMEGRKIDKPPINTEVFLDVNRDEYLKLLSDAIKN